MREGFTLDLGEELIQDLETACDELYSNPPAKSAIRSIFRH